MRSSLCLAVAFLMLAGAFTGCLGGSNKGTPAPDAPTGASTANGSTSNMTTNASDAGTAMDMSEQNKTMGEMPHIHDYWAGRERVTLMDQDVTIDFGSAFRYTFQDAASGTPGVGGVQFVLPEEHIVYEGAGKLELTASWTDPTVTGMGVTYRSAAGPTWSKAVDLKSGSIASIEVKPEMTDMPHSKNSQWGFQLLPDQSGQIMGPNGKVHIRIDIIRMHDISLFPAHPNYWNGAHQLEIFKGPGTSSQTDIATSIANAITRSTPDEGVKATGIVPMETMSMTGNLTIKNVQVELGKATNITLMVKPANSNNFYPAHVIKADSPNNKYWFAWLVDMRMADAAYAKQSNWKFDVLVTTDATGGALVGTPASFACGGRGGSCVSAKVDYELDVQAFDSAVAGAAKLMGGQRGGG